MKDEDLIEVPPEDQMGEALLALEPRQRKFVCALAVFGGDQSRAYAAAGYKIGGPRSAHANASRLANSEKVIAAIREETIRRLGTAQLLAVSVIAELANPLTNSDKKLRFAAAQDILDRVGLGAQTTHNIVVKDERTTQNILEAIKELTGKMPTPIDVIDVTPQIEHKAVDAEFSEIPAELADLL